MDQARRLALVVVLALVVAAPAAAGTVSFISYPATDRYNSASDDFRFVGDDRAEDVRAVVTPEAVDVTAAVGTSLTAGEGCAIVGEQHLRCPRPVRPYEQLFFVGMEGGGGDDRLELVGGAVRSLVALEGGPGDDVLIGGDGADDLEGGPGRDEVFGGEGADDLRVGADDAAAGETYDGGAGRDTLSLADVPGPVTVDLAAGLLGFSGGDSRVARVEDVAVRGVRATLLGDDGPNHLNISYGLGGRLEGRGGDDGLLGSAYPDVLLGGDGADGVGFSRGDQVDGGPGDDVLYGDVSAEPGARQATLACGEGMDAVQAPGDALVPPDCERLSMHALGVALRPILQRERARVVVPITFRTGGCGFTMRLRTTSGVALTQRRRLPIVFSQGSLWPHLPLTRAGRRALADGRLGTAVLEVDAFATCPRRRAWHPAVHFTFRTALT